MFEMKAYVKPELFYESFELSQNIAACGWDLQFANKAECYAVMDGDITDGNNNESGAIMPDLVKLFVNNDCTVNEVYCYTNGSGEWMKVLQS